MVPPPAAGFRRSRALWDRCRSTRNRPATAWAWASAILYELQPLRYTVFLQTLRSFSRSLYHGGVWWFTQALPQLPRLVNQGCQSLLVARYWRVWILVGGAVGLYIWMLRRIHEAVSAGPLVLILTALVTIWTVGLSDHQTDDGMPSAYAVFNKGFQKLMGSVDADALLQQHLGGGFAGMMMMQHDGGAMRNDRPDDDVNNNNNHNAPPHERRAVRRPRKKQGNRERNQQRRELQRQRQAAADLGFGGQHEQEAMDRLVGGAVEDNDI